MSTRNQRAAVLAVSMGVFCIEFDSFALNLALPQIGAELPAAISLQWTISAYLLTVGSLMLGAGRLADVLGRRRVLIIGLCMFGVTSMLCATAPTLPFLVAARALQGAGGALIIPAGLALLTNLFAARSRPRMTGYALASGGIAMACGPFVGGLLTQLLSWRALFWLNVPLVILAVTCAWLAPTFRDTRAASPDTSAASQDTRASKLDVAGLASATAAIAALVILVDRWDWMSPTSGIICIVFLALATIFIHHERGAADPLVDPRLFRNAPYVTLTAAGAVANTATVIFLFVIPLSLQRIWGLSPATTGMAFLLPAILMSVTAGIAGRIPTSHAVPTMAVCLGCATIGLCALAWVSTLPGYFLAISVCGATLGLAKALTLIATQGMIRLRRAGEASGVTKTAVTVCAGLGVTLTGPVAEQASGQALESAANTVLTSTGITCLVTSGFLIAFQTGFGRYAIGSSRYTIRR